MSKVTVEYNGKKIKVPLIKCDDCEGNYGTCKECLKRSFEEACINAGQTKLLGGEYITKHKCEENLKGVCYICGCDMLLDINNE